MLTTNEQRVLEDLAKQPEEIRLRAASILLERDEAHDITGKLAEHFGNIPPQEEAVELKAVRGTVGRTFDLGVLANLQLTLVVGLLIAILTRL